MAQIPSVQQDIKTLFEHLSQTNERLTLKNKKAVLVIGIKESGKTTLSYYITGHPVSTVLMNGKYVCVPQTQHPLAGPKEPVEGPNEFQFTEDGEQVSVVDLPNLEPSNNIVIASSNFYFLHRFVQQFKSVKILLVMTAAGLKNAKASIYISLVTQLFNLFKDPMTVLKFSKSIGIVFNKALASLTMEDIHNTLHKKIESKLPIQQLSQMLLKTGNIAIVNAAGAESPEQPSNILRGLLGKMSYFQSELQLFNLQSFFDLLDKSGKDKRNAIKSRIIEDMDAICMQISTSVTEYSGSTKGKVVSGIADVNKDPTSGWAAFFLDTYGYASHRKISKQFELTSALPSLEFLIKICEQPEPTEDCKSVTEYASCLLSCIQALLRRGKHDLGLVQNMHYLFLERMNYKRILHLPDNKSFMVEKQNLRRWCQLPKQGYEEIFILQHKIQEEQSDKYYNECRQLLLKYCEKNGEPNMKLYQKLATVELQNSRMCQKRNELFDACKMLLKNTKYMKIIKPAVISGDRYQKIANILLDLKVFCVAVELYKAINDMDKVQQCYEEMYKITKNHQILYSWAKYLERKLRVEKALGMYERAERLARGDPAERQKIRKDKENMVRKRWQYEKEYLEISEKGGLQKLGTEEDTLIGMIESWQKGAVIARINLR